MTCASLLLDVLAANNLIWLFVAAVCAPFVSALAVYAWYEWRHRAALAMHRMLDRTQYYGNGMGRKPSKLRRWLRSREWNA